jgi:hypothetical protein
VHQAVLVHAQVDEGAELRHVADRALEHHAGLQVLQVLDALVEARHDKVRPRVAAGLLQLDRMSLTVMAPKRSSANNGSGLSVRSTLGPAHQLLATRPVRVASSILCTTG